MSFIFGGQRPQPSKDEKFAMLDMEFETSTDIFTRMMGSCMKKCVLQNNKNFVEGELNKGESVCLDRCVAKFLASQQLMQKKMEEASKNGGGMMGM
ncbi:putative mitochondrial import inner membrane translocase subunit tim10 [Microthyrium microscopicum]|uniref:Mitochondrial import inner membrane translocase subunit n=1 Tax=Microthyrium microscopicum TaxID=703497 RepID=A0A6A6U5E5_9PEZI|nr:putative mitochondrial import inner membrane translocase subunit tim10 [Microthyrium microscopicum]